MHVGEGFGNRSDGMGKSTIPLLDCNTHKKVKNKLKLNLFSISIDIKHKIPSNVSIKMDFSLFTGCIQTVTV